MVSAEALNALDFPKPILPADLPEEELRWCTVKLNEVLQRGLRLEASVFDVEGKHAREVLNRCKWPETVISGDGGFAETYHRPRFKRIWIEEPGIPIFQPSQIQEIYPKPSGYLSTSTKTDIDALKVHKGQILLTCSGTIGLCAIVSDTMDGQVFSHDLFRITCKDEGDTGYLYAFLKTKIGNTLIRTNEYGAVVSHIEPEHIETVPIPDPPKVLKKRIHDLVIRSYTLRDESNVLLDKAERFLCDNLNLPPLKNLQPRYFDKTVDMRNYSVKLSNLAGRLDASYRVPIVDAILQRLNKEAAEITTIDDPRISKRIILPGRFARVFVQEGQGAVYFTGKHILELDPSDKKYLAFACHAGRIREQLMIKENMLLVASSGTLGKVVLVPQHWDGWTMTHDIIRLVLSSDDIAGYIWIFLTSAYGQELVRRYTYGSVVDHIEAEHIAHVPVPLLKDAAKQAEINRLALRANAKRTEAYHLEQEAIRIVNDEVMNSD